MRSSPFRVALSLTAFVVLVAGLVLGTVSSAVAEDRRPCVSRTEFVQWEPGVTKFDLEIEWDVSGLGHRAEPRVHEILNGFGLPVPPRQFAMVYPACAFRLDDAFVVVQYRRDNHKTRVAIEIFRWGAPHHGHLRLVTERAAS